MWQLAVRTVFDSFFCHSEVSAALIAQCIQWTIAEQAVKVLWVCPCMAWKIFTFSVTEESVMLPFPIWFLHRFSPRYYYVKKIQSGTAKLVIFDTYLEDLRYCSGVDNESVQICGGNECIRSSTACHLIIPFKGSYVCGGHHDTYRYNSYEQANSIKKCLLPTSRQRFGLRIP